MTTALLEAIRPGHTAPAPVAAKALRVAIYCRVSTLEQAERGYSLAAQLDECRKLALSLSAVVVVEYQEQGSGADWNLPKLLELLERAERGEFDTVICLHTSRFSRDRIKAGLIKRQLRRAGVTLRYVQQAFDDSPSGRLMENLFEDLDDYERENIAMRFALGKQKKAHSGLVVGGGHVPYGYRRVLAPVGRRRAMVTVGLEPDPDTAPVARRIFREVATDTVEDVAARLTAEGIPSPYGCARWTPASVARLVRHPVYIGDYRYGRYAYTKQDGKLIVTARDPAELPAVEVPALVSPAELRAALEGMERRKKHHGARRPPETNPYTLQGLLTCGACDGPLSVHNNNGCQYYACLRSHPRTARQQGAEECSLPSVQARKLEALAWDLVSRTLLDPEYVRVALGEARKADAETIRKRQRIADLRGEVERLRKRLDRVTVELLDAEPGSEAEASLRRAATASEREIAAHRVALTDLEAQPVGGLSDDDAEALAQLAEQIRADIADAETPTQRRVFELLRLRGTVSADPDGEAQIGRTRFHIGWTAALELRDGVSGVSTPDTEWLYSGDASSSASAAATRAFSSATSGGRLSPSKSPL